MLVPTSTIPEQKTGHNVPMKEQVDAPAPVEQLLEPPSLLARYTSASILIAIFAIWGKYSFVGEKNFDETAIHDYKIPLALTMGYLGSLPVLRFFSEQYLSKNVDVKLLLRESMIIYNAAQVLLNCWMVYTILQALFFRGHPFIGDLHTVSTGATYAVWIHYTDKYLEFLDTYFMVLRGKMDQVRLRDFLSQYIIPFCTIFASHGWPMMITKILNNSPPDMITGVIPSHLSSCNNCMGVVGGYESVARRWCLLWCSPEFVDPCNDVLVLHS